MHSIYVIQEVPINGDDVDLSPIKIGFTSDLKLRITSIQIGNPRGIKLIALMKRTASRDEAMKLENHLHRQFSHNRIRGEWFDGSIKDEVVSIIETWEAQGYPIPQQPELLGARYDRPGGSGDTLRAAA